jgi:hypothetical protein
MIGPHLTSPRSPPPLPQSLPPSLLLTKTFWTLSDGVICRFRR